MRLKLDRCSSLEARNRFVYISSSIATLKLVFSLIKISVLYTYDIKEIDLNKALRTRRSSSPFCGSFTYVPGFDWFGLF